jgi:hypothetical protein
MTTIIELNQTCFACPSQWEGKTADGRHLYIRYRWGHLSISMDGTVIIGKDIGGAWDGVLNENDLWNILSDEGFDCKL